MTTWTMPAPETCWEAVSSRDRTQDGRFYYAVVTTGIFCRPSCPSRLPRRENVRFYPTTGDAARAGFRPCFRCRPLAVLHGGPEAATIARLCRFIERNLEARLTLKKLSAESGLSPYHLQRKFKAIAGISPRDYVDACRLARLKRGLRSEDTITAAMVGAGYGSSSRLYERSAGQLGMTPGAYRRGAPGVTLCYATAATSLGTLAVAASEQGVCAIVFGDSPEEAAEALRREFPRAEMQADDSRLRTYLDDLMRHLHGDQPGIDLPLDIRATAFQRLVWSHLRTIPYGSTESYQQVAAAIGRPGATRAVARACATNRIAIAIPCHRVVRTDGEAGGYRWGIARKEQLLDRERQPPE